MAVGRVQGSSMDVTVDYSSSKIPFTSDGTLIGAAVLGNAGTWDGIPFALWSLPLTTPLSLGMGASATGSASWGGTTSLSGLEQYKTIAYTPSNEPGSLTISGLDAQKVYRFQYGFCDSRPGHYPYSVNAALTLSDSSHRTVPFSIGAAPVDDDYALVTALVTGTTSLQLYLPTANNGVGPILGCVAVHEENKKVPNPSPCVVSYTSENLVPVSTLFTWDAPTGVTVSGYDLYIDPNVVKVLNGDTACLYTVADDGDDTDTQFDPPSDLAYDTIYYWRVDVREPNAPGADIVNPGMVLTFKTVPQSPVITVQPADQLVFDTESAVFSVTANDPLGGTLSYQWYKYVDGTNDTLVGTAQTLTVSAPLSGFNEGEYYCVVSNATVIPAVSEKATLAIKALVAQWKFDNDLTDAISSFDGVGVSDDPNYVSSAYPGLNQSAEFDGSKTVKVDMGSFTRGQFSVSFWAKVDSAASSYNAIMTTPNWASNAIHIAMNSQKMQVALNGPTPITINSNFNFVRDEWFHFALSFDGSTQEATVFVNGDTDNAVELPSGAVADLDVFHLAGWEYEGVLQRFFKGQIDDVQLYNYPISAIEAADIYINASGKAVCLWTSYPAGDLNEDCQVNLDDFAMLALDWLESGLYSHTAP